MTERMRALVALCPPDRPVVDVGADHGHVAHALGGIAVERMPHRAGRPDVRWVIADGLSAFREVPVAVLAGIGARSIAAILERGPRPGAVVCHAPDDPGWLRGWLAEHGWRIDAEALAEDKRRFAEVLRALPGEETASGLALELGPRLLEGDAPLRAAWLEDRIDYWAALARETAGVAAEVSARAAERARFLAGHRRG